MPLSSALTGLRRLEFGRFGKRESIRGTRAHVNVMRDMISPGHFCERQRKRERDSIARANNKLFVQRKVLRAELFLSRGPTAARAVSPTFVTSFGKAVRDEKRRRSRESPANFRPVRFLRPTSAGERTPQGRPATMDLGTAAARASRSFVKPSEGGENKRDERARPTS